MSIQVLMSALFPMMKEGSVRRWLVEEGKRIKPGQPVAEIQTDDGIKTLKAEEEGVLSKILVAEGNETVSVGTPIAVVAEIEDRSKSFAEVLASSEPSSNVSPLARRVAEQAGINLAEVKGSGPAGRIVLSDVEIFIAEKKAGRAQQQAISAIARANAPSKLAAPSVGPEKTKTTSSMLTGPLVGAKSAAPVAFLKTFCKISPLLDLRRAFQERHGQELPLSACFVRAAALGLKSFPAMGSLLLDGSVVANPRANVAFLVGEKGLRPVVKGADAKTLTETGAEIEDLCLRSLQNGLKPEETQDAGLSVVDLSSEDIAEIFLPPFAPETAALVVGGIKDATAKEPEITLILSADTRAIDILTANAYLSFVRKAIEQPYALVV
jgi:pyruvate dehydrogenase E2 component (dihydrolipoamide acetyltransferase)